MAHSWPTREAPIKTHSRDMESYHAKSADTLVCKREVVGDTLVVRGKWFNCSLCITSTTMVKCKTDNFIQIC